MTKDEQLAQIMRYMNTGGRQIDAPCSAAGVKQDLQPRADTNAMRDLLQRLNKGQQ